MLYDVECLNCGLIKESVGTSGLRLVNNCNRHNSRMLLIKDKHIRHIFSNMVLRCYNITDSERGWARRLGLGINFINRYNRRYGKDKTIDFIRKSLISS